MLIPFVCLCIMFLKSGAKLAGLHETGITKKVQNIMMIPATYTIKRNWRKDIAAVRQSVCFYEFRKRRYPSILVGI